MSVVLVENPTRECNWTGWLNPNISLEKRVMECCFRVPNSVKCANPDQNYGGMCSPWDEDDAATLPQKPKGTIWWQ